MPMRMGSVSNVHPAMAAGRTEIVADVDADPRYLACFATTRSEIVVPIFDGGRILGNFEFTKARQDELLQIYRKTVVQAFAEKPQVQAGWINGGFFVLNAKALDYIFLQESLFFQKLDRHTILVADQARRVILGAVIIA